MKEVDGAILKQAVCTRKALSEKLDESIATAENIQKAMKSSTSFVSSTDEGFRVEDGCRKSCIGEGALPRVQKAILNELPTSAAPKEYSVVVAGLKSVQESKVMTFSGNGLGPVLACVIQSDRLPQFSKLQGSSFKDKVTALLGNFCQTKDEANNSLVGGPAAKEMFKVMLAKYAAKTASVKDANLVIKFGWLLDEDQQKKLPDIEKGPKKHSPLAGGCS